MGDPGVSLTFDAILVEARQRTNGLDDFGDGPFLEPLQLLLDSLESAFIANHPKGKDGIHRYEPAEFGVDPAAVRRAFGPYMERFGLAPEPD